MELNARVGLITGGTSGIGGATAFALARRGVSVMLHGRNEAAAAEARARIGALGQACEFVLGDIGDPMVAKACVARTLETYGGLDLLVHCAGGAVPGGLFDVTPEAWYRAFDVHVHAIFHLCREAVPAMKARGGGSIVLISSAAGLRGCLGALAYGVVKGSLPQFARSLARELADDNIRVNCVSPGIIRTPFQDHLSPAQARHNVENRIPLHREGSPEDVSDLIVALLENDFVTGENVAVDGGMTMRIV